MSERGITRLTRRKFTALFREVMAAYLPAHGPWPPWAITAEAWAWANRERDYERGYNAGYKRKQALQVPRATPAAPDYQPSRVATHGLRGLP